MPDTFKDIATAVPAATPLSDLDIKPLISKGQGLDMIDDTARIEEILREELKAIQDAGLREVAVHYHMTEGDSVQIDPRWRTMKFEGSFPLDGLQGHVTEVGFRTMIRCQFIGAREVIHSAQYNANWQLKSATVKKGKQGYNNIKVVKGRVAAINAADSPNAHMLLAMPSLDGTDEFAPPPVASRTCLFITYELVDITGNSSIRYKEGRTMSLEQEQAQSATSDIDRLINGLANVIEKGAKEVRGKDAKKDAVDTLCEELGVTKEELHSIVAKARVEKGKPAVSTTNFWHCPIEGCDFKTDSTRSVAISQHLQSHVRKNELTEDAAKDLLREWDAWNQMRPK